MVGGKTYISSTALTKTSSHDMTVRSGLTQMGFTLNTEYKEHIKRKGVIDWNDSKQHDSTMRVIVTTVRYGAVPGEKICFSVSPHHWSPLPPREYSTVHSRKALHHRLALVGER